MSTWAQLTEELNECERRITATRLKCEEKLQQESEKLESVMKKRAERLAAHEKDVAMLEEESQEQLANVEAKAESDIQACMEAKARADDRTRIANSKAAAAEQKQRELQQEMVMLRKGLDATLLEEERQAEEIKMSTGLAISAKMSETDLHVCDIARFTSEIQNDVTKSVEDMHEKHKVTIKETEDHANDRSRYRELTDAALAHGRCELPAEHLQTAKETLSQSWKEDWEKTANVLGPQPLWTDGLCVENTRETPLMPRDLGSLRPSERARRQAVERQVREWKQSEELLGERDVKALLEDVPNDATKDGAASTGTLPPGSHLGSHCATERARGRAVWRGSDDVQTTTIEVP